MSDSTLRVAHVASNPAGLPIQAPPANLGLAMAEQLRRGDAAAASVAAAPTPTVTPAAALKEAYLAKNTGFFACHHANLAYPMRCMVPNERYIDWQPAASQSAEHVAAAHATLMRRVRALSADPRLPRVIHNIVPANMPHLIPYSEAAAADPDHVLRKIHRNANRLLRFYAYRDEEFKARAAEVEAYRTAREVWEKAATAGGDLPPPEVPPPTATNLEQSEYHRYKTYLSRRRTMRLAGPNAEAAVAEGDDITAADALREAAAAGRAVVQRISAGGEAAPAFQPPVPAPGMEAFMSMDKAPEPVFVDGSAPAALVGADLHPDDQVIGDWPRDLERRAVFMNLAMVDDLDVPEDSPAHPGAAGMEPMMIPFGGVYETEEEAKDAAREEIAPWAAEFKVCTISMNGFLWATEVDPDKIKEQHRTGDAGGDAEMALVMGQNKTQKATAAKARLAAAAAEAPLRETNANAALPEVDEVSRRNQPAVTFAGEVQQFGRGGVAIGSADPSPAVAAAVAGIIDL